MFPYQKIPNINILEHGLESIYLDGIRFGGHFEIMSTYQDFEIYYKIREISILGKKELSYSKNRLYLASKPTKQF